MRSFIFTNNALKKIHHQAISEYPSECCGWIIQESDGTQEYYPQKNLQDQYHKLDPKTYPRTSKEAFLMNTLLLNKAIETSHQKSQRLFCIVHSHIDCGAYFSEEDKKQMSNPEYTEQLYPVDCYLVVSIQQKKFIEQSVFYFDKNKQDFKEAEIEIV